MLLVRDLAVGLLLTSLTVLAVGHVPQAEPAMTTCATPGCR